MKWWHSRCEERWEGPCDTREFAIADGHATYPGAAFMVMEASQGFYNLRVARSYNIIEDIAEDNAERSDPDGDGALPDVTKEQEQDLEVMLNDTIEAWAVKHKIDTVAFCFEKQGKAEIIDALPEPPEP